MTEKNVERFTAAEEEKLRMDCIQKLQQTGDLQCLQRSLLGKLMSDPQWYDSLKERLKDVVQEKEGRIFDLTLDELVAEVGPVGKASIPRSIENEIMVELKDKLSEHNMIGINSTANGRKQD